MPNNISFIIPAYNSEKTLDKCVLSIIDGNIEKDDEIIIVDDASTDRTPEIIMNLQKKYLCVKSTKHNINKCTAAASRNTGIDISKNEIIFCLDSDNLLAKNSISRLKGLLLENNADAVAFGEIRFFVEDPQTISHKWVFENKITFAGCLRNHNNPLTSGNYMFTKDSWKRAGRYFEPKLENQTLDSWTFGIRQLGTGANFLTLPDTYYYHKHGHQSHYIREISKGNVSLSATIAIIPFLDKIKNKDVDYIFSRRHRDNWWKLVPKRPIRLKSDNETKREFQIRKIKNNCFKIARIIYRKIRPKKYETN